MSAPKLSLPLVAAALPFMRLRRAVKAALGDALAAEAVAPSLAGLAAPQWGEDEERMGFRLAAPSAGAFAFVGVYMGPETVHPEAPDLYFFLEVPRGSVEQEGVDERAEEIGAALTGLNRLGLRLYWGYTRGGTHGVWAVMSLLDALRSGDPEAAVLQFCESALRFSRDTGLMALFFGEAFRRADAEPSSP